MQSKHSSPQWPQLPSRSAEHPQGHYLVLRFWALTGPGSALIKGIQDEISRRFRKALREKDRDELLVEADANRVFGVHLPLWVQFTVLSDNMDGLAKVEDELQREWKGKVLDDGDSNRERKLLRRLGRNPTGVLASAVVSRLGLTMETERGELK